MVPDEVRRRMPEVPGSVQRVLDTLTDTEAKTMKQIREESGLARRTVYGAVRHLREMGLVRERTSLRDSRQTYIWLAACRL